MIRNLKALGLAMVAVFAMSAMAASAAHAEKNAQLTAEASPAVMDGNQIGEQVLSRLGRTVKCVNATFSSEAENKATTLTVIPTYSNCTSSLGPATVTMNGCDYLFHLTADKKEPEDTWTAVATVVCAAGKSIEVDIYTSAANHTAGTTACKYKFGSQTVGGTIDLTNEPAGGITPKNWIKAHIKSAGIVSTSEGSILLCGAANDATGTLTGEAEFKGTDKAGGKIGITISTDI